MTKIMKEAKLKGEEFVTNKERLEGQIRRDLTLTRRCNEVNVYFPVRGHSFLPCDSDFGVINISAAMCIKFDRQWNFAI